MSYCTICNRATGVECGGCYSKLESQLASAEARVKELEARLATAQQCAMLIKAIADNPLPMSRGGLRGFVATLLSAVNVERAREALGTTSGTAGGSGCTALAGTVELQPAGVPADAGTCLAQDTAVDAASVVRTLGKRVQDLSEALRWYADGNNWSEPRWSRTAPAERDFGRVARDALAERPPVTPQRQDKE